MKGSNLHHRITKRMKGAETRGLRIAIVGVGVAGCAAAWYLNSDGVDVTLIEKSRGVSGRAATRGRGEVRFDHGANFFKLNDRAIRYVVQQVVPSKDLVQIEGEIVSFSAAAPTRTSKRDGQQALWTYRDGISRLGKLFVNHANVEVQTRSRVQSLRSRDNEWYLSIEAGVQFGPFDCVLLTPPAPQTVEILSASTGPGCTDLMDALRRVDYASQFAFILGYERAWKLPVGVYGWINSDTDYPIAWLSREEAKPGHVPEGQRVVICQMQPWWTKQHFHDPVDSLVPEVAAYSARILGNEANSFDWYDHQRWRYARPQTRLSLMDARRGEAHGLFLAGDFLAEQAGVPEALHQGLEAARRIGRRFGIETAQLLSTGSV